MTGLSLLPLTTVFFFSQFLHFCPSFRVELRCFPCFFPNEAPVGGGRDKGDVGVRMRLKLIMDMVSFFSRLNTVNLRVTIFLLRHNTKYR